MFFLASKLLNFLISPFTWIIIGILLSLLFYHRKWSRKLALSTLLLALLLSNHWIINIVSNWWEKPYIGQNSPTAHYTYAIVLGGMAEFDTLTNRVKFAESANRLFDALPLLHSQIIDTLIISGGSAKIFEKERLEASFLKEYCSKIGLNTTRILVDSLSRNTYENGLNTAKLLANRGVKTSNSTILLITSSYHMPRAMASFKKCGIKCSGLGTHSLSDINEQTIQKSFTFTVENISKWDSLIHEWMGYLMYKLNEYC